jgi:hypothetical protein
VVGVFHEADAEQDFFRRERGAAKCEEVLLYLAVAEIVTGLRALLLADADHDPQPSLAAACRGCK